MATKDREGTITLTVIVKISWVKIITGLFKGRLIYLTKSLN